MATRSTALPCVARDTACRPRPNIRVTRGTATELGAGVCGRDINRIVGAAVSPWNLGLQANRHGARGETEALIANHPRFWGMRGCDAMIVNLTPFRGPSADVGSAYEMGFMRALGRPVFAYSNDARPFLDRVAAFCGETLRRRPTGEHEDPDGMAIEAFALHDNLMLAGAVADPGACLITAAVAPTERYTALSAFERCVEWAAAVRAASAVARRRRPGGPARPRAGLFL